VTAKGTQLVPPNPLISVCIANHNYARFLPAAIDSALAQTYSRVELVVVDDGSTDDSRHVIARYGDRVRAVLQERTGQAAASWAAEQAARGDVVVFLDADDMLDPAICRHIADTFEQDPGLVIVQWRLSTIDAEGRPLARVLPPRPGLLPSGDLSEHVLRVRNWQYQLTTGTAYAAWAVRRLLPADLPEGEHHALDQWLNELAPLLGPIRSLDDVGGAHRIHDANFSAFAGSSADWPRRMIRLTLNTHEHVRRLAAELGRSCPEDARAFRDPAFLGWRLWSLTVDPGRHPLPSDRRLNIAAEGIVASLAHPHFPWRNRLKRAAWFAAVGGLPQAASRRVIDWYKPDGPLSLATRPGRRIR
jgi:glycosyltransferase involved in cell wall biosynthesis